MAFKMTPPTSGKEKPADKEEFTVIKVELDHGVAGEANNDGTIFVDDKIENGSVQEKEVVAHEGQQMKDMKEGILDYEDNSFTWKGKTYPRKNGKIKYKGKWINMPTLHKGKIINILN